MTEIKKSYLRLCDACDLLPAYPKSYYNFMCENYEQTFGHVPENIVGRIEWNDNWTVNHEQKTVLLHGRTVQIRTQNMRETLLAEREKNTFQVLKNWSDEPCRVFGPDKEPVLDMERRAVTLFGIVTHAVMMIMYQEDEQNGMRLWLAKRSATKILNPNYLGATVAGGMIAGETPWETVVREGGEEASLKPDDIEKYAKSTGLIKWVTASDSATTSGGESGLIRAEVIFTYEMRVGSDVIPTPFDGEASEISLFTVQQVKDAIDAGTVTPGNAVVMLDFFIKHGIVTPENEVNYSQIVKRMQRDLFISHM